MMVILIVLAFITLLVWVPFLKTPLYSDPGIYAYIANRMVKGDVLYKDLFECKPCVPFFIYAFWIRFFGKNVLWLNMISAAFAVFTMIFIYLTLEALAGPWAGICGAALWTIYSVAPQIQAYVPYFETYSNLPLVAGLYFFIVGAQTGSTMAFLCSGIAASIAWFCKQPTVASMVPLAFSSFFTPRGLEGGAFFLVGVLGIQLVVLLYFVSKSAGKDYLYLSLVRPLIKRIEPLMRIHKRKHRGKDQSKKGEGSTPHIQLWEILSKQYRGWFASSWEWVIVPVFLELTPLILLGLTAVAYFFTQGQPLSIAKWGVLLWFCFGIIGPFWRMPLYITRHYFIPSLGCWIIMGGLGLNETVGIFREWGFGSFFSIFAGVSLLVAFGVFFLKNARAYFTLGWKTRINLTFSINRIPLIEGRDIPAVAQYVSKNTSPEDRVLETGYSGEALFRAERQSPVGAPRIDFPFPQFKHLSKGEKGIPQQLKKMPPRMILLFDTARRDEVYFDVDAFARYVGLPYEMEKVIGATSIYRVLTLDRDAFTLYEHALQDIAQNNLNEAIGALNASLEKDPVFYRAMVEISICYGQLGQIDKALERIQKAIELRKDVDAGAHAYLVKANLLQNAGNFTEAIQAAQKATQNLHNK